MQWAAISGTCHQAASPVICLSTEGITGGLVETKVLAGWYTMPDKKIPQQVDLVFKEPSPDDALSSPEGHGTDPQNHAEAGPSSLYGRRGDNMTFHTQGVHINGYWYRQWSWIWKDLREAFFGLLRIFFSR